MKSIRTQLARQILGGTVALLLVAGSIFCAVIHSRLVDEFDRTLEAEGDALESLTSREGRKIDMEFAHEGNPEFEGEGEQEYFEVFLADGTVLRKSATLGGHDLPFDPQLSEDENFRNVRLPDGRRGRLMQIVFMPEVDEPDPADLISAQDPDVIDLPAAVDAESAWLVLVVARSRESLDGLLLWMYLTLGGLSVLLLGGMSVVVRRAIGRGFEPLDAVNTQIKSIGPQTLDRRVQLDSPREELATILAGLNALLERVEDAFARERQFSSDVAHELRTPVAELRAACEIATKWPDDAEATKHFFNDAREVALQMEKIVSSLLTLSRCESGNVTLELKPVRLETLVCECWERVAGSAASKGVCFENGVDHDLVIETDPSKLEMIVQNLVENAMAYSVGGTMIKAESAVVDSRVDLTITNKASNLSAEDLAHVFDRFWQKDPARSDHNRSGLGLSIAKALCGILGLRLAADLKEDAVFEVRLSFPKSSRDSKSRPRVREAAAA